MPWQGPLRLDPSRAINGVPMPTLTLQLSHRDYAFSEKCEDLFVDFPLTGE